MKFFIVYLNTYEFTKLAYFKEMTTLLYSFTLK